jgi:hypothetical protein
MTHPLAADAAQALQGVTDLDELAYRFWSIHPKDIPDPVGMPEGYKGGARAWFYANQMRAALAALSAEAAALKAQVAELTRLNDTQAATIKAYQDAALPPADDVPSIATPPQIGTGKLVVPPQPYTTQNAAQPDAVEALVAEAVAQERERAAKVAQDRYLSWGDDSGVECDATACADIAAAIRAGGKP